MELSSSPLLGTCPDENTTEKDAGTSVFIAALFAVGKTWKQSKGPSTDEWIKKKKECVCVCVCVCVSNLTVHQQMNG